MLHIKSRLLQNPELSDFRASVFHQAVIVLLLITHSCKGQSHLIGPTQTIVAMVGDDIVLPCGLEPAVDASGMTVEWARLDLQPRFVYLRRDGGELLSEQNLLYKRRTSLSINKLKCGDVSLKLSKVKLSDAGTYKCLVPTLRTEALVEVAAGSVSSPDIKLSKVSTGVMLECRSGGWYPEPEVLWLDAEGKLLSAGPTETVRRPDDLYTVSSRLTVEKRLSNSFTCRVQQNHINQTRETHITVPDDFFMVPASSAVRFIICFTVCFVSVAAAVFVVVKWGRNKADKNEQGTELQPLVDGQRDGDLTLTERMKLLDMNKAKLDEELQRNERELQHAQHMIKSLMEQKKDLKQQREKLYSLLQEVKTQIEQNNKKLKEKTKTGKDKKMSKRKKAKEDLEKRKTQHEELLKSTDTLLETTENMIIRMREEKVKLENYKDQKNKLLTENQTQRDETQRKLQVESEKEEENKTEEGVVHM